MNDDEMISPNGTGTATIARGSQTTWSSGADAPPSGPPPAPIEANEFSIEEVEGDPVFTPSESSEAQAADEEVASGEGQGESSEFAEASAEQLAAESGEESVVADLRGIEGFEESVSGGESGAVVGGLEEVGEAAAGDSAEFLPFLAALVPTLISSVGPAVARGIAGRLSPKAKRALGRIPAPGGAVRPGSTGALLAQIAQLLRTAASRPGGESGMEGVSESVLTEAVQTLELIIGNDDRIRIRNTTAPLWRRICALRIAFPTGAVYKGTGFLIGPRAVATAGHCVYLHTQGGWARSVEVIPGMDGQTRPFSSSSSSRLRSVSGWVNGRRAASDYGCILLPPSPFGGRSLGSFGVSALGPAALVARPAVLAVYPGDKPFAELWGMARKIKTVGPATLAYDIDTMGGQSGAPVYIKRDGHRTVVGIHNYGSSGGNSATRVTPAVAQRLKAWSKL